jgi:hypothetical protein
MSEFMHLATVSHSGQAKVVAALDDTNLLDLRAAPGSDGAIFADMQALIEAGEDGLVA